MALIESDLRDDLSLVLTVLILPSIDGYDL